MKIECSQEEFTLLQNRSELDSLRNRLQLAQLDTVEAQSEARHLEDRLCALGEKLRVAEDNLANQASGFMTRERMKELSEVFKEALAGNKIPAIKALRATFHCGLKEAKDIVEGNYPDPTYRY